MKKLLEAVQAHTRASVNIRTYDSWLQDWFKFKSSNQNFLGLDRPTDVDPTTVEDGDIYLLSPQLLGRNTRPLLVMIVGRAHNWYGSEYTESDDCTVVVPFSPLSSPAFRFELEVDSGSVLQIWNTRCMPNNHLSNAWKMGVVDQQTLDDAFDVAMYQDFLESNGSSGRNLPKHLFSRISDTINSSTIDAHTEYYNQECELADNLEL